MKAKKIQKIRSTHEIYLVVESKGLFGDFSKGYSRFSGETELTEGYRILARNPEHAAKRYIKRFWLQLNLLSVRETVEKWATLRVVPESTPYKRKVKYYSY